ncbi:hypothetical protein [Oligoflexus tunisiensis]|uniref:hypothetical protein n=1 Tax=Oligoflexus tunisiensis TaxID=708132 RepID=UPI00114D1F23|nr:hypothetical protein [Oligoflexus tunisiensis]
MRSLWTMGLLSAVSCSSWTAFSASTLTIDVTVHWEGRELLAPNLDALERLRKAFPDIPVTHFVNPTYFLDETKAAGNVLAMHKIFAAHDEVGLYLVPMEPLVKKAGVILKLEPTFWGYLDEGELCRDDCGLDVPLTVYTREETLKLLAVAQRTLHAAGFTALKSFTVRGWMGAPYITELAAAFGYRFEMTPVDPGLVTPKLGEFPISAWVQQSWSVLARADAATVQKLSTHHPTVRAVPQRGGIVELNDPQEILARFDRQVKEERTDEVFTLALSAESAFLSWPKLRAILKSLQERAKKQKVTLHFATVSGAKNSRPTAANVSISTRLSQHAEAAD